MSGYRCVNYYDLCRMCTTSTGTRIHIFSAEGKKKNLYQKILECLPVVVDEKDKLPKILCGSCLQQIESIAEFRNICLNSQTMLESCLNSTTLQNGGKVYIKDATTQKVVTTTQNIVKSEPVTVTNATTQSTDFLSSIIQAVGIQSTDDSGTDNRTQIIPQYTVTIDGKAIKTGQVEYKVEETSQAQSERQAKQNSLAEFLKMKPNIRVTPIPKKKDPTPAPPPQQTMTVPIQHPVQIKTETPKAKKPKYNIVLASPAQQKTTLIPATSGPTSTGAKTVSLQDLKILSSNKCFLPITIKDSNSDQQIVAQIDTKNLVLPTTYHLQMKLQPQIATVDGQPIVQLTPTAIPATLSLAPTQTLTTQNYQTDQQTHNSHIISSGIDASTSTNDTEIIFTSGQLQNHHQVPANSITFQQFQPSANVQTTTTPMPKLQIVPTSLAQNNPQIQVHHTKPQNTITVQRITTQQAQIHQQQQQQHHHQQQAQQQQQNQQQHQQTQQQQHHQQTHQQQQHHHQQQQQQQQQQQTIVQKIKTEPGTTTTVTTQVQPQQQAKTTVTAKAKAQTITVGGGGAVATAVQLQVKPDGQLQVKPDGSAQECTICGRAFKKKEHLAQHMKLHAGLRPFKCKEVGCNKSFSRKEHLMRHLVSHTGKKMFSCDLCQKLFSRKDNLNKHKRTHSEQGATQNGQFVCEICNKTFVVKMYYQQHKAMHEQKGQTTPIKGKVEKVEKNSPTSSIESKPIIETMQTTANINQGNQQIMQLQISPTVVSTSSISNQSQQQQTTTAVLKTLGSHDTTVLNLPSNLSNLISINSAQFMTTGELLGQFKIENEFPTIQWQEIGHKTTSDR